MPQKFLEIYDSLTETGREMVLSYANFVLYQQKNKAQKSADFSEEAEKNEKLEALERIKEIAENRISVSPDFDPDKALEEALREKYGFVS